MDRGLGLLEEAGLAFDLVAVLPEHLALVPTLVRRHPELRIVIDHLAKPPIGLPNSEPWWSLIREAAEAPTVYVKVSGLYSAAGDPGSWSPDSIRPYPHRALDCFGADRLMYGGDWPISVLSGGYDQVWDGLTVLLDELSDADRSRVLGETAIDFYRIAPARIAVLGVKTPNNPISSAIYHG